MSFDPNAYLNLTTPEGIVSLNRYNAALYTFLGENAFYNHVFVQTTAPPETVVGVYIFNFHPRYPEIKTYMHRQGFPEHRNLTEVQQCDVMAFERTVALIAGDFQSYPEAWDAKPE